MSNAVAMHSGYSFLVRIEKKAGYDRKSLIY